MPVVWQAWDSVFVSNVFDARHCNFYVHAPARSDGSVCPVGHDALTVLVPCPLLPPDHSTHDQV